MAPLLPTITGPDPSDNTNPGVEPDINWKNEQRKRIEDELQLDVDKARQVRDRQLALYVMDPAEKDRIIEEHSKTMAGIRQLAQDHYMAALGRERRERQWLLKGEIDQALVREQEQILQDIQRKGSLGRDPRDGGTRDTNEGGSSRGGHDGEPMTSRPPRSVRSARRASDLDSSGMGSTSQIWMAGGPDFDDEAESFPRAPGYDRSVSRRQSSSSLSQGRRIPEFWRPSANLDDQLTTSRTFAHATAESPVSPTAPREGIPITRTRGPSLSNSIRSSGLDGDIDVGSYSQRDRAGLRAAEEQSERARGKQGSLNQRPEIRQRMSNSDFQSRRLDERSQAPYGLPSPASSQFPPTPDGYHSHQLGYPVTAYRPDAEEPAEIPIRSPSRMPPTPQGSPGTTRQMQGGLSATRPIVNKQSFTSDSDGRQPQPSPNSRWVPPSQGAPPTPGGSGSSRPIIPQRSSPLDDSLRFPQSSPNSPGWLGPQSPPRSVRRDSSGSQSLRSQSSRQFFARPDNYVSERQPLPTYEEQSSVPTTDDDTDSDDSGYDGEEAQAKRDAETRRQEAAAQLKQEEALRLEEEARQKAEEVMRIAEEAKRKEEEARRREEEAKQKEVELQRKEEEAQRLAEEVRQKEEEARRKEEEVRRKEEEVRRMEEEARRREEEARKREEEARKREEEMKRKEEEARQKEREIKLKEEEARRKEKEAKRKEQAMRRKEELAQRREEEMRLKEEENRRNQEEIKRKEEELRKREEELDRREREAAKLQQEALRREQEARQEQLRREEEVRQEQSRRAQEAAQLKEEEEARTQELTRREQEFALQEEKLREQQEFIRLEEEAARRLQEEDERMIREDFIRREREAAKEEERLKARKEQFRRDQDAARSKENEEAKAREQEEIARREQAAKLEEEKKLRAQQDFIRRELEAAAKLEQEEVAAERERLRRERETIRQQDEDRLKKQQQHEREVSRRLEEEKFRKQQEEFRRREERKRQDSAGSSSESNRPSGSPSPMPIPGRNGSTTSSASTDRYSATSSSWGSTTGSMWSSSGRSTTSTYTQASTPGRTSTTPTANVKAAGGWKTAGTTPAAAFTSSAKSPTSPSLSRFTPEEEEEWSRRQDEQARTQQEKFQRMQEQKERENQARTTKVMSKEDVVKLFEDHERRWAKLPEMTSLSWYMFPWPMLKRPEEPEDLTTTAISAYVLSPHSPGDKSRSPKDRIKEHIRRWHPDRFETKLLPKVREEDREKVQHGAGIVARNLNELLTRTANATDMFS